MFKDKQEKNLNFSCIEVKSGLQTILLNSSNNIFFEWAF